MQQFGTENWRRYMEDQPQQDPYQDLQRRLDAALANSANYESYGTDSPSEPWYEQWIRAMEPVSKALTKTIGPEAINREYTRLASDPQFGMGFAGGAGPAAAGKSAQFLRWLLSKLSNQGGYFSAGAAPKAAQSAFQATKQRGLPGVKQARRVAGQLVDDYDMLKYFTPSGGYSYSDLVAALRRNLPLQDELLNAEPDLFKLGAKSPRGLRGDFQDWSRWQAADSPTSQAITEALNDWASRAAATGSGLASDLQGAIPAAGKAIADWFPTAGRSLPDELAGLVEKGGRAVADVGSRLTEDIRKQGWLDPRDSLWAQKLRGASRKRYQAAGAKNAAEGSDLWQRDILKDYYRDIKPTASRMYSEAQPFLQEWGPLAKVGGQGAALLGALASILPAPNPELQPSQRWQEIWSGDAGNAPLPASY